MPVSVQEPGLAQPAPADARPRPTGPPGYQPAAAAPLGTRIRCLGVFTVDSGDGEHILQPSRRMQLFALLVLNSGRPVASARLMRELWDQSPPDTAKNALHAQIVRLRRDLSGWTRGGGLVLRTQFPGYQLDLRSASLDVHDFAAAATQAHQLRRQHPRQAIAAATAALDLWRGSAFTGMALGPLGEGVRRHLNESRFTLLLDTIDLRLDQGEHSELIPELHELTARWPLCERLHAQLMTALYRAGRLADALRLFENTRGRFDRELGVAPSPQLNGLVSLMLRHDPALWRSPTYGALT
jgi:DNA-binding SARP family transcriptional activator